MHTTFKRMWLLFGVLAVAASALVLVSPALSAPRDGSTLVIWTDQARQAAITQLANQWAAGKGITVNVVLKDTGSIRDTLGTVAPTDAPDVITAAHDWTGQLAANGLVEPLFPSTAVKKQFPAYTLGAFSYGVAVKKLYGIPVSVENIGLVVDTALVKVPKTWAQLESEALAFKRKAHQSFGIAVQQGTNGDGYHMYPFFSGLGGYVFGTNSAGNLDPSNIGLDNKTFLKNAHLIDKWNKEGLINAKLDGGAAQNAFLKKQTPFWVTGPWNSALLEKSGIKFTIIQIPKIVYPAVPFLGVQGVMVTKYATEHGVDAAAKDFVTNFLATPSAQTQLAAANGRPPANIHAKSTDPVLREFSAASTGGVPMPNIPQMQNVWTDLGEAWVRSTKGAGAMPATRSFTGAARSIADKIG